MNLRTGLLRAWAVFSAAWVVFWLLEDRPLCAWGHKLTGGVIRCVSGPDLDLPDYDGGPTAFVFVTTLLSGPVIVGALILAGFWITAGFKGAR